MKWWNDKNFIVQINLLIFPEILCYGIQKKEI